MRTPLTPRQDFAWRRGRTYKALTPVALFLLIAIIFSSVRFIGYILVAVMLSGILIDTVIRFSRHRHTLRGAARRRFNHLYDALVSHTEERDIVSMVLVMERMAMLMEANLDEVHTFLCETSFAFTTLRGRDRSIHCMNIIILVTTLDACKEVWQVLKKERQELPEYLSHPEGHMREAAMERMKELQGGSPNHEET